MKGIFKLNSSIEFKRALTEVAMIIHKFPSELQSRIPSKFKMNLLDKMDISYTPSKYDKNKTIDEQDISEEAKMILASIYREYIVSEEEKKQLIFEENEIAREKEKEKRIKYSTDVFKNKKASL